MYEIDVYVCFDTENLKKGESELKSRVQSTLFSERMLAFKGIT